MLPKDAPEGLKKSWEKIFKQAKKSHPGDEGTAAQIAWGVVKKRYAKDAQGKWHLREAVILKKLSEQLIKLSRS